MTLGRRGGKLTLRQQKYRLLGLAADDRARWRIPVRLRGRDWFLLDDRETTLPLPPDGALHPNDEEWSYYRWSLPAEEMKQVAETWRELDVRSRLGLLHNSWSAVSAGELAPAAHLEVLAALSADTERPVIELAKCKRCFLCYLYCPEAAMRLDAENFPHVDYEHCKGCMICYEECPTEAISRRAEL